jgi:hypothetical protein
MASTTLWNLRKGGQIIRCLISDSSGHEELQVWIDNELYIDEVHTAHGGAGARAQTLRRGYEARGWTAVAGADVNVTS